MMITKLKENQTFVFGSNARGHHAGGAAGAVWGQAKGLQGQSYGIVTLDESMHRVPLWYIEEQLKELREFAIQHPDKEFLVTAIGCGIAGFRIEEIATVIRYISKNAGAWPSNVIFPEEFKKYMI
jgi:hypothetical protein